MCTCPNNPILQSVRSPFCQDCVQGQSAGTPIKSSVNHLKSLLNMIEGVQKIPIVDDEIALSTIESLLMVKLNKILNKTHYINYIK